MGRGIIGLVRVIARRFDQRETAKQMLIVRPATFNDAYILFVWRNDPISRAASLSTDEVPWDDHVAWLAASLTNPDRFLFIASIERVGQPPAAIGMTRFDVLPSVVEVSINLDPGHRGRGLSSTLLAESLDAFLAISNVELPLSATIRSQNEASIRLFAKARFQLVASGGGVNRYERPAHSG